MLLAPHIDWVHLCSLSSHQMPSSSHLSLKLKERTMQRTHSMRNALHLSMQPLSWSLDAAACDSKLLLLGLQDFHLLLA